MSEKMITKEELLSMLSEMNDKLEELDNMLESEFSCVHQNWYGDYKGDLLNCNERMTSLEKKMESSSLETKVDSGVHNGNRSSSMKLELGF